MSVYEINVFRSEPEKVGLGMAAPRVPLLDLKTEDAGLAAMNLHVLSESLIKQAGQGGGGSDAILRTVRKEIQNWVDSFSSDGQADMPVSELHELMNNIQYAVDQMRTGEVTEG